MPVAIRDSTAATPPVPQVIFAAEPMDTTAEVPDAVPMDTSNADEAQVEEQVDEKRLGKGTGKAKAKAKVKAKDEAKARNLLAELADMEPAFVFGINNLDPLQTYVFDGLNYCSVYRSRAANGDVLPKDVQ